MKRAVLILLLLFLLPELAGPVLRAADAPAAAGAGQEESTVGSLRDVKAPHFLEHLVDLVLEAFGETASGNTPTHYFISGGVLITALLLRRFITGLIFGLFRRAAKRTQTTLDDKMFTALEPPVATLVLLVGLFAALRILKLSETVDQMIAAGATVAFSLAIFWLLLRGLSTLLDHAHAMAVERQKTVAAFMPWIKRTVLAIFVAIGVLMVFQSLGFNVRAILAGLGLGGLAFALAAQDTLANLFGSIVVAVDQPFRVGEFVQIGANAGAVEDIGLRSTRLRRSDKALVVVPNKAVASEVIVNFARFTRRRNEQVISLTYDTRPEQMEAMVAEIRQIIASQPEVDPRSILVYFRDLAASSLDIWIVYETPDPDFLKHMAVKQRINLALMRAVEARGLRFAMPTRTIQLEGPMAERLADNTRGSPAPDRS